MIAGSARWPGGEQGQGDQGDEDRSHAGQDGETHAAGRAARPTARVLEDRVGDDQDREAAVPEHVQPRRRLGARAEQAGRREEARKWSD
jgi:hypothetical protein